MPIVTGDLDPYRRQDQLNRFGRAGEQFVSLVLAKRQKEERERERELVRAMEMLERYPEVVDRPEGKRLVEQFPELEPIFGVMRNRQQVVGDARGAFSSYTDRAEKIRQSYGDRAEGLLGQVSNPLLAPQARMAAAAKLKEIGQKPPDAIYGEAARELSPRERMLAQAYAKGQGVDFPRMQDPDLFDPGDLPADVRAVEEQGKLTPEAARAARIKGKLELSPSQERQYKISERGQDLRKRGYDIQEQKLGRQGTGSNEPTEKQGQKDRDKAVKNLSKSLQESTEILERETKPEGRDAPPQVKRLLPIHSRRLSEWIADNAEQVARETGQDVRDVVMAAQERVISRYQELLQMGIERDKAVKMILSGEEKPKDFVIP